MNSEKNIPSKDHKGLDKETFLKVRKWYLLAFAAIAITVIIAQVLIQNHLDEQLDDSRVINVAGRQRAYSQKLVKEVMLLNSKTQQTERSKVLRDLKKTLNIWKTSHHGLQKGNDSIGLPPEKNQVILSHFKEIKPYYESMIASVESILSQEQMSSEESKLYSTELAVLLENEGFFLSKMDAIVNQYDLISKEQLKQLKFKEYVLLIISLLILLLEILYIFRPLSIQIRETVARLLKSTLRSEEDRKRIEEIVQEKEASLEQLKELNFAIDNAALFASTKLDGTVDFVSKKFITLLGGPKVSSNTLLSDILTQEVGQQQYLRKILTTRNKYIRTEEIEIINQSGQRIWLDMSIIPIYHSRSKQSILILCSDISGRKETEQKMVQITERNYENMMLQKQLQASQVVAGQEEERKRIAKDIHDEIGQMLTAFKFNIESINLEQKQKALEKIKYLKDLAADLIKGVRTATFNLTPPELGDYGLYSALQKMTKELGRLTGKKILFESKVDEIPRLDPMAEINMYRVTQEAVNNAIKYADSKYILVSANLSEDLLSISITDDGKGFDMNQLDEMTENKSDGGMGIFFMKERIGYINGRIFIHSKENEGTRITLNYRLKQEKKELHGEK